MNRNDTLFYRTENKKKYRFLSFASNLSNKYGKKTIGYCFKNMTSCSKNCFNKTAKATREFTVNNIVDKIVKPKPMPDMNPRNVEETVIPPEKREEILNELRQILQNEAQ